MAESDNDDVEDGFADFAASDDKTTGNQVQAQSKGDLVSRADKSGDYSEKSEQDWTGFGGDSQDHKESTKSNT